MAVRVTFLDRAIAQIAPRWAADRVRARAAFEAFSGESSDRAGLSPMNGRWHVSARSADADIVRGLKRQRAESRELRRLNPIAAGAIGTNLHRIVGTGIQPVPTPDLQVLGWTEEQGAEFAAAWSREFSMWADCKECTLDRSETFYERQASVLGARLESGDCFTLLPDAETASYSVPYRLRLQLLEADRVGNPVGETNKKDLVEGVRIVNGVPTSVYVFDEHPGAHFITGTPSQAGKWYDFYGPSGRRRILQHFRPTRPEQTRGVPYLAPVIQAIKDLGRYTEAEITAAVLSAFFTVFIEQEGGSNPAPIFGAAPTGAPADGVPLNGQEVEMGPGAIVGLAKGEKPTFANPNRPNTAYEPFVLGVLKLIAIGLHLPLEVLLKTFNASFSASKAALLDAAKYFMTERAWLVNSFCQPVYETLMAEAVASGRLAAPGFFSDPLIRWAYTRAAWWGDSAGSINPKDEVAAYTAAIDARLMTHERAEWELFGTDWTRTFPTKVRELTLMRERGIAPEPKAGAARGNSDSGQGATP